MLNSVQFSQTLADKIKYNNIIMMPASSHLVTTISENCQLKFLKNTL